MVNGLRNYNQTGEMFFRTLCLPRGHLTPSHSCGCNSKFRETRETESITSIFGNSKLLLSFYSSLRRETDTFEQFVDLDNERQNRLSPKSNFDLYRTENANVEFTDSKQILAIAILLVHPKPLAQLNIRCDASDFAVVATVY